MRRLGLFYFSKNKLSYYNFSNTRMIISQRINRGWHAKRPGVFPSRRVYLSSYDDMIGALVNEKTSAIFRGPEILSAGPWY